MKYCTQCGSQQSDDAIYCSNCGARMDGFEVQRKDRSKRKKLLKWVLSVSLGIIVIAVTVILSIHGLQNVEMEDRLTVGLEQKITSEMVAGEELPIFWMYSNAIREAIEFDIVSCNEKKKEASVKFTYVDAISLADCYAGTLENPELFYQYCVREISAESAPQKTETIRITYSEYENEDELYCIIEDSPELVNVLTGGTYSEYVKILEEVG